MTTLTTELTPVSAEGRSYNDSIANGLVGLCCKPQPLVIKRYSGHFEATQEEDGQFTFRAQVAWTELRVCTLRAGYDYHSTWIRWPFDLLSKTLL